MNRDIENRSQPGNSDCRWFDSATEGFFAGALAGADRARFESHGLVCASCAATLSDLRAIDPLMKDVLRYRLALAQASAARPPRVHWGRMATLAGAMAGLVAVGVALWPSGPVVVPPVIQVNVPLPEAVPIDDKDAVDPARLLGKPGDPRDKQGQANTINRIPQQDPAGVIEEFALIDPAGQVWTLDNYRGNFFLFGVLPPADPRSAANLERLYRTFGPDIRLVAVSNDRRSSSPPKTTFLTFYNNASRLLGAKETEFVLVDSAGSIALKGSLAGEGDAVVQSVRSVLQAKKN